jgi:hypothetical protein
MLYLKEGDLYKNVRIFGGLVKSPFYGHTYILIKGEVEDTWTLSYYDEENDKILPNSSYVSNISYDDMLLLINDDTALQYYKPSNHNLIKSKELDIEVGDLVEFGENPSYAFVTSIYKSVEDFIYVLSLSSNTSITRIAKKEAIKKVYKKIN